MNSTTGKRVRRAISRRGTSRGAVDTSQDVINHAIASAPMTPASDRMNSFENGSGDKTPSLCAECHMEGERVVSHGAARKTCRPATLLQASSTISSAPPSIVHNTDRAGPWR